MPREFTTERTNRRVELQLRGKPVLCPLTGEFRGIYFQLSMHWLPAQVNVVQDGGTNVILTRRPKEPQTRASNVLGTSRENKN